MRKMLKIAIFILPQTLLSTIFATEEIFSLCNEYCKQKHELDFKTTLVSTEENIHMQDKEIVLQTLSITHTQDFDVIFIPPMKSYENFDFNIPLLNT